MNWQVRDSAKCTVEGCTRRIEIEALREKIEVLTDRIVELRGALDRLGHHEICHESCEVCKLLALPQDSSALDELLVKERAKMQEVFDDEMRVVLGG